jgi:hypothetical protein
VSSSFEWEKMCCEEEISRARLVYAVVLKLMVGNTRFLYQTVGSFAPWDHELAPIMRHA